MTRRYPPLIGGAEKVLSYLAPALAAEGAEVVVLTARPPGGPGSVEEVPVRVERPGQPVDLHGHRDALRDQVAEGALPPGRPLREEPAEPGRRVHAAGPQLTVDERARELAGRERPDVRGIGA